MGKYFIIFWLTMESITFYFLVVSFNTDMIEPHLYTTLQVFLGLILSIIYILIFVFIQLRIIDNNSNYISISSTQREGREFFQIFFIGVGTIICMIFSFAIINKLNQDENNIIRIDNYKIITSGKQYFRKNQNRDYIVLKNKKTKKIRHYYIYDLNSYMEENNLRLYLRKGDLGFNYYTEEYY